MILSLISRFICGFVVFKAYGGFSERFINLCNVRGIMISNVRFDKESLEASIRKKDYIRLRAVAKASGMKLCCVSKHGLPFFLHRHKNRVGLIFSFAFFIAFMCVMSMFIWSVETVGSESLSDTEIFNAFSQLGVYAGAYKKNINARDVARQGVEKMNGKLHWAAVNIKGTRAVIEVRDYIEHRDDTTFGDPCNIVADFDGLLLSIEVEGGTKANHEGNGVKKGDLLISGMKEDRYEITHFYEARGVITALHNDSLTLTKPVEKKEKRYYKAKAVKYLNFFIFRLPLGAFTKEEGYDEFSKEKILVLNGVSMPISITEKTRAYFINTENKEENSVLFYDDFITMYREKYKNTSILSSKIKIRSTDSKMKISSDESCIDFMGKKQILSFDD